MTSLFRGLTPVPGAQIQVLLVGHGRAAPGEARPAQLLDAAWPGVMRNGPAGVGIVGRASFPVQPWRDALAGGRP